MEHSEARRGEQHGPVEQPAPEVEHCCCALQEAGRLVEGQQQLVGVARPQQEGDGGALGAGGAWHHIGGLSGTPESARLEGAFLWDNPYIIYTASAARSQLTPGFAVKALVVLRERLASSDSMSAWAFQDSVCKPMKIVEVWQSLMKKRYGSVATGSAALERLVASLTQWVGLQTVSRCAQTGVVLHGESAEKQGIPECWLLQKEFDKCLAGGLPLQPESPQSRKPARGKRK